MSVPTRVIAAARQVPRPASPKPTQAAPTVRTSVRSVVAVATRSAAVPVIAPGYGCSAALAYLRAHAAPGFQFQCPGYAFGNQAMTCVFHAPQCPGAKVIAIAVPCPAAYENEASNSWVLVGASSAPIDPFGYCP